MDSVGTPQLNNNISASDQGRKSPFSTHVVEEVRVLANKKVMKILVGILSLVVLAGIGFFIIGGGFTRASDVAPQDVSIENVTDGSAVITWKTAIETQGVVEYGTSSTALNFFAPETEKTKDHRVEITLLSPETTYYFRIRIGDNVFDNGGVPWIFTTKSKEGATTILSPSPVQEVSPSPEINISPTPTPTPYEVFELDPTPEEKMCDYNDCDQIKQNLGKGCSVSDYLLCVNKGQ